LINIVSEPAKRGIIMADNSTGSDLDRQKSILPSFAKASGGAPVDTDRLYQAIDAIKQEGANLGSTMQSLDSPAVKNASGHGDPAADIQAVGLSMRATSDLRKLSDNFTVLANAMKQPENSKGLNIDMGTERELSGIARLSEQAAQKLQWKP
jgi:hypothetical protein